MAANGFADHYLTDCFAAGHNRTARISATNYWNEKVPMFFHVFQGIHRRAAGVLHQRANWRGHFASIDYIWGKAKKTLDETLEEKGMPDFRFGDLVVGAVHDYDNEKGVAVTVAGATRRSTAYPPLKEIA